MLAVTLILFDYITAKTPINFGYRPKNDVMPLILGHFWEKAKWSYKTDLPFSSKKQKGMPFLKGQPWVKNQG